MRTAAASQLLVTLWFLVIWISLRKPLCLKKYDLDVMEQKETEERDKKVKAQEGEDVKKKDES